MRAALASIQAEQKNQLIFGAGRTSEEKSIIIRKNGQYLGFGYLDKSESVRSLEDALSYIRTYPADTDVQNILHSYLSRNPNQYEILNLESESGVLR